MKKTILYILLRLGIIIVGIYVKAHIEYLPILVSAFVIYLAIELIPLKKIKKTKTLNPSYPYLIFFGIGMMALFWGLVTYYLFSQ
jgi:hypothetical protein